MGARERAPRRRRIKRNLPWSMSKWRCGVGLGRLQETWRRCWGWEGKGCSEDPLSKGALFIHFQSHALNVERPFSFPSPFSSHNRPLRRATWRQSSCSHCVLLQRVRTYREPFQHVSHTRPLDRATWRQNSCSHCVLLQRVRTYREPCRHVSHTRPLRRPTWP